MKKPNPLTRELKALTRDQFEALGVRFKFRFNVKPSGFSYWRCYWFLPSGLRGNCGQTHSTLERCLSPKCMRKAGLFLRLRAAKASKSRSLAEATEFVLSVLTDIPHKEDHLGMVILPPGVSRQGDPAAKIDPKEPAEIAICVTEVAI